MARAFIAKDGADLLAYVLVVGASVEGQDGGQLLIGIGMSAAHAVLSGHQHTGGGGNIGESRQPGNGLHAAAHDLGVHGPVGAKDVSAQLFPLRLIEEVSALLFHLGPDSGHHILVADNGLFGGADGAVVKGLGVQDALDGQTNVGGMVDIGRTVARPHTDGGGSGGVGRLYHGAAAGGQNEPGVIVLHQRVGGLQRGGGDAGDGPFGSPRRLRRPAHHLHCLQNTLHCAGVGGKNDGIARLHADHGLIDHRGGGIGGWYQPGHDPHRHPDVNGPLLAVLGQDAMGLFVLDCVVQCDSGKAVLDLLVGFEPKPGLFHRQPRQTSGLGWRWRWPPLFCPALPASCAP